MESALQLTIYNEDEVIPKEIGEAQEDVEFNYLRVRGAEAMQKAIDFADKGQFE